MSARRPDDDSPGLPPEWAGFVVPDDISELAAESRDIRAELTGRPRHDGLHWLLGSRRVHRSRRLFRSRRRGRFEPSGMLVLAALVGALFIASLGVFLQPAGQRAPAPRPLANTTAAPGVAGALVPDLAVTVGRAGALRLRTVRPAVLVVVPPGCTCGPLVSDVINQTAAAGVRVLVIGSTGDPALPSNAPTRRVSAGTDAGSRLAAIYQAGSLPLLLFVRSDGMVTRVMPDAQAGTDLRPEVAGLAH